MQEQEILAIHTGECQLLLKQALEIAQVSDVSTTRNKSRYADSSSDEDRAESDSESSSSSSSSSSSAAEEPENNAKADSLDNNVPPPRLVAEDTTGIHKERPKPQKKKRTKLEMNQRQREQLIQKHYESLACECLSLSNNKQLRVPMILFPKDEPQAIYSLAAQLQQKPVVVFALRSGRFAGAVFQGNTCVVHTTSQRYTVRRGQGKAQSSQDNAGAAPKSMGAQLRRHGEMQLQKDIANTMREWNEYLKTAALIFISCPKTMRRQLLVESLHGDDSRIRRVPLDIGRPSFEAVSLIHAILTRVIVEDAPSLVTNDWPVSPNSDLDEHIVDRTVAHMDERKSANTSPEAEIIELTPLHEAARDGNIDLLEELFESDCGDVNGVAGEDLMTPLHYAAKSEALTASSCVMLLLEKGKANPCKLDKRNRVPYYLSSHDRVRDAFRRCRASLGEEFCSWDAGAKVGPPLTEDDLNSRKEKEAEKRRRKKARRKEKQAKETAQAAQAEQARKEEEARQKEGEEAKRGSNVCDFCQTVCRKKSQMFQRLTYSYCSTECVNKHKRELMASAALARFG